MRLTTPGGVGSSLSHWNLLTRLSNVKKSHHILLSGAAENRGSGSCFGLPSLGSFPRRCRYVHASLSLRNLRLGAGPYGSGSRAWSVAHDGLPSASPLY